MRKMVAPIQESTVENISDGLSIELKKGANFKIARLPLTDRILRGACFHFTQLVPETSWLASF